MCIRDSHEGDDADDLRLVQPERNREVGTPERDEEPADRVAVSYTHLTLPTSDLV